MYSGSNRVYSTNLTEMKVLYHIEYQTIFVLKSVRNRVTSLNSYWRYCKNTVWSTAGIKSRPVLFWDMMPCCLVEIFRNFGASFSSHLRSILM